MAAPTSMIVLAAASTLLYCISPLPPASHWLPLLQAYIPDLIECLEREGLRPVPIFINGVEAHTVVSLYSWGPLLGAAATDRACVCCEL